MSDDSSWYSRALARARGVAPPLPQQRPQYPVQQQPQYPQPQQFQQPYPGNNWGQAPTQQPAFNAQQKHQQADLSTLFKIQEDGHGQPGPGSRENPDPCPNCGAALFIENLPGGRKRRGPPPAPHCFSCGYNGLFEQGLQSSWGA